MHPKLMARLLKFNKMKLIELWIDVKYGVIEWVLLKTKNLRLKYSKKLILTSHAYYDYEGHMTWDDVEVNDQWNFWLPLSFGIISKANWEFDNQVNRDCGLPEDPWQDVVKHENWWTYCFEDEFLNSNHYFWAARKHLKEKLGDDFNNKELELRLEIINQDYINADAIRQAEWIKEGKPKYKIEFGDKAKENLEGILGEDEANKLFDEQKERNRAIDEEKRNKKINEQDKRDKKEE